MHSLKRGNVRKEGCQGKRGDRQRCENKGRGKKRRGSMLVVVNLFLAVERGEGHVQIYGCLLGQ